MAQLGRTTPQSTSRTARPLWSLDDLTTIVGGSQAAETLGSLRSEVVYLI